MKENVDKYKISWFAIVGKEKIKRKTIENWQLNKNIK